MIQNNQSDNKCLACDEPKPGTEKPKEKEKKTTNSLFTATKVYPNCFKKFINDDTTVYDCSFYNRLLQQLVYST